MNQSLQLFQWEQWCWSLFSQWIKVCSYFSGNSVWSLLLVSLFSQWIKVCSYFSGNSVLASESKSGVISVGTVSWSPFLCWSQWCWSLFSQWIVCSSLELFQWEQWCWSSFFSQWIKVWSYFSGNSIWSPFLASESKSAVISVGTVMLVSLFSQWIKVCSYFSGNSESKSGVISVGTVKLVSLYVGSCLSLASLSSESKF